MSITLEELKECIETRFDGIDTRLDGIETRLDRVETRLDRVETRLDRVEESVQEVRNSIIVIENEWLPKIGIALEGVEGALERLREHDRRISGVEKKTENQDIRLRILEDKNKVGASVASV